MPRWTIALGGFELIEGASAVIDISADFWVGSWGINEWKKFVLDAEGSYSFNWKKLCDFCFYFFIFLVINGRIGHEGQR